MNNVLLKQLVKQNKKSYVFPVKTMHELYDIEEKMGEDKDEYVSLILIHFTSKKYLLSLYSDE